MIKQIITTTTLIAAAAAMANAATPVGTVINFDFGQAATGVDGWNVFTVAGGAETTGTNTVQLDEVLAATNTALSGVAATLSMSGGSSAATGSGASWNTENRTTQPLYPTDEIATLYAGHGERSLYNRTGPITVTISGLDAGFYNLDFLAARGNNNTATMTFNANGVTSGTYWTAAGKDAPWVANTGVLSFTANTAGGGIFGQMQNIEVAAGGDLTFTIVGTAVGNANNTTLNMLSITAIPEPSMFGLLAGLGALALVGARRRRK